MNPITYLKSIPEYPVYIVLIGDYDDDKEYAGPQNKSISKLIPRKLWGIDCNIAFYQHDALYEKGGSKKDRWTSDGTMLITILWCIENYPDKKLIYGFNWLRKHLARELAIKYFEIVLLKGHEHFNFKLNDEQQLNI